jgi:flagellar assembly protein FliH
MRISPFSFKELDTSVAFAAKPRGSFKSNAAERHQEELLLQPPPPPSYTEADLAAAQSEAYKNGFVEGIKEGRMQAESEQAEVDRKLSQATERFVETVAPLLEDYRRTIWHLRGEMPKVALAVSKKIAGDALGKNAGVAVESVALACVETMITEPKLLVTVHTSLAATLEKKLQDMAARLQSAGDIVVMPDAQIVPGDCRIEWKHGALERNAQELWQQIERTIENMSAGVDHTVSVQMENLQAILAELTGTQDEPNVTNISQHKE